MLRAPALLLALAGGLAAAGGAAATSASSGGWQDNYHIMHKGTTFEGMSHSGPANFLMCNKRCGSVAPISLETAMRICNGNTSQNGTGLSNTCWGFSYDTDAHVVTYAQGITSDVDTYVTKTRFWRTALPGYKEFAYDTEGALLDVTLVHTYQLPVSLCASTCDDDDTCTTFQIDSDSCKLFEWKLAPVRQA